MDDPFDLRRFVEAQRHVYDAVRAELQRGRKETHWMWFVFPQIEGLGHSTTARRYAISSPGEARGYLEHSLLGPRLLECTALVNACADRSLDDIFGFPDNRKFHSCMTLFANVTEDNWVFMTALKKYCGGQLDPSTVQRL